VDAEPGSRDIAGARGLRLGSVMSPGSYILELTVFHNRARNRNRATQAFDIEVVD
jgi:hypothetical protein